MSGWTCCLIEQTERNSTRLSFYFYSFDTSSSDKRIHSFGDDRIKQSRNPCRVPKEKDARNVLISTWLQWQLILLIRAYVPKRGKFLILFSAMSYDNEVSYNESKPQKILDYNRTKGSIDTLDLCIHAYNTWWRADGQEMPKKLCFNKIDTAAYNRSIIFFKNESSWMTGKFIDEGSFSWNSPSSWLTIIQTAEHVTRRFENRHRCIRYRVSRQKKLLSQMRTS